MDIETQLLIIEDKETSLLDAEKSIACLYEKFRGFIYNITYQHIGFTLRREELALSVVSEVFILIWNSPLDWKYDKEKHKTQEDGFKAYLAVVAHYKLMDELRKNKDVRDNESNIIDDDDNEWKWALLNSEFDYLDKELENKRNLIDECLLYFPERNRDIIRMYFLLYDDDRRMTREKIDLMEKSFDTTWQNIRQIIFRTKKKIEVLLKDKLQIK